MNPPSTREEPIPSSALTLGLTGLIPFFVFSAVIILRIDPWESFAWTALRGYGAIILSFLGAVHWGLVVGQAGSRSAGGGSMWRTLGWGVTPALVAWIALLTPQSTGVVLLVVGFAAQYWADEAAFRAGRVRSWYIRLRRLLTAGAVLCLCSAVATTV